ncbi:myb/SANT-like domain, Harbinger transposase-derived nuclease domain protein [Senna tora]|uniref:Myb/SANT-like domain, Harbinger transposase-derived nuclease domain protein n=1 Tax=Senna tora TaxID=362788 RepID=A0A834T2Y0_9FABA|nr:myb/SANT-like domain, Harbinger transposase-derived nuclease domain protein [Senna tora]
MRHSSVRNVIERCFGMLKMRWTILRNPMEDAVIEGDGEGDYAVNSTPMETHNISSIETSTAWSNWRDSLASVSQEQKGRDSQEQGGGSSKRPLRLWTPEEDKALVESMLELQLRGTFNADNGLKPGSYRDLEKKMESKLPRCGIKAFPHIQSRYKSLKASWKEVFDMFYGPNTSGFGWDSDRCM